MLFRKQADGFIVTAFGEPAPLRVGTADVSVMLQSASDQNTVLGATVNLHLKKSSPGSVLEVLAPASHAHATNKLLYAARVTLPSAGEWQLSVDVKEGNGAASAAGEINVLPPAPAAATYWSYIAIVPIFVLLFVLNRWLRRRWGIRSPQARP